MRPLPILLLAAGLTLAGCDGDPPTGEPPTTGTLVVSTSTRGEDPDPDGYLLTVDDADSLDLDPTGRAEIDVEPGWHSLRLLDVSDRCAVAPRTTIEVNTFPGITTPVVFEVTCSTGVRVTVRTTGLDIDPDGYRVEVDGSDREPILANGQVLTRLEPGSRTITLTGLTSNCTLGWPESRTVSIAGGEVAHIYFAVVCTATSGVIGVGVTGSDIGLFFQVVVDGTRRGSVYLGSVLRHRYWEGVPAGAHVVSLMGCSIETEPRTVTVLAGSLIRDTVEVTFSVTCPSGTIRITAPTTGGFIPQGDYTVYLCTDLYYCDHWLAPVIRMAPNDTLLLEVPAGTYRADFWPMTTRCRETAQNPRDPIQVPAGGRLDLEFRVGCS